MREINEEYPIPSIFFYGEISDSPENFYGKIYDSPEILCVLRGIFYTKKVREHSLPTDFLDYLILINVLCLEALQVFCLEVLDVC